MNIRVKSSCVVHSWARVAMKLPPVPLRMWRL
jgi:hypothetical protein